MLSVANNIVNKCIVRSMCVQINCAKYNLEKQFFYLYIIPWQSPPVLCADY